jgi:hypothetical protein
MKLVQQLLILRLKKFFAASSADHNPTTKEMLDQWNVFFIRGLFARRLHWALTLA